MTGPHGRDILLKVSLAKRLVATVLLLAFQAGPIAVCAGWHVTADERMECCLDGDCPMHHKQAEHHVVTQAQADACCAVAEQPASAQPSAKFALVGVLAPVVSPIALDRPLVVAPVEGPPILVPRLASHVPKHVLLSVFLI